MALANVTQEIIKAAKDQAAAAEAEAQGEISQINADADAKIAELKDKEDKKLKEAIEHLTRQEISSAELESKKIVLAKKKELLNDVFEETLADLVNAPSDVKLAQYKAMVEVSKTILANPKALMSEKEDFTAEQLGVTSVEKTSKVVSGLILQSEDGEQEIDMQYSTLLRSIWDREIKTVSDILFG